MADIVFHVASYGMSGREMVSCVLWIIAGSFISSFPSHSIHCFSLGMRIGCCENLVHCNNPMVISNEKQEERCFCTTVDDSVYHGVPVYHSVYHSVQQYTTSVYHRVQQCTASVYHSVQQCTTSVYHSEPQCIPQCIPQCTTSLMGQTLTCRESLVKFPSSTRV